MKKSLNRNFLNIILDKFLLIVTAILVGAAIVGGFALLDHYHVSTGWSFFVYLSILYVILVTKFCLPSLKRSKNKKLSFMLLMTIVIFEIAVVFLICYFDILPLWEKGLIMITVVLTVPLIITVILFDILLKCLKI